jgi:glycosyltransferase involved in cell wall biosynthesis
VGKVKMKLAEDIGVDAKPLVSIIINNYNYERYLSEAIDSAIAQTYPHTEVIVVDDGSTDKSREIIANYGDRVIPVLKQNGGQASAFNTGLATSKGEIIIYLDSDDVLLPNIVKRVVEAFQTHPEVIKVQYQLRVVDGETKDLDKIMPDSRFMPNGNLKHHIRKFHTYGCPPTSGNAFASKELKKIFPVPEKQYRIAADEYVNNLVPILGPILSLTEVGGLYRVHGNNNYCKPAEGLEEPARLRKVILQNAESRNWQRQLYNSVYSTNLKDIGSWELGYLKYRVSSLKQDPINHPFPDNLLSLCVRGCISCFISPYMRFRGRLLFIFWFIGMLFIPRKIAKSFTEKLLYPEERKQWVKSIFASIRRFGKQRTAIE